MSDNIQTVLQETLKAFQAAPDDQKMVLASKLGGVLEGLVSKLSGFTDIPENFLTKIEPQIAAQVKAIDKRTEHAVDQYLGASERLGKIVKDAPDDIKKAVQAEINVMFEASNFQDLVSQHANEIKLLVEDVKADMTDMKSITGGEGGGASSAQRTRNKNKREDSHLLNGPAMPVG